MVYTQEDAVEQTEVGQTQQTPYRPGMPDRRQRKPDIWARVFRYVILLVYPVLVVFLFIFLGVASVDRERSLSKQMFGGDAWAQVNTPMDLYTLLPLLTAGLLVGIAGLVLSHKRGRRRTDYHYQSQLILVILSVGGLVIFFLLR